MTTFKWNKAGVDEFRQRLAMGVTRVCQDIDGEAKKRCPVKTANLQRSIHTVVYMDGRRLHGEGDEFADRPPRGIVGQVGTNVYYGIFVHDGTVKMTERPFLLQGMQAVQGRVVDVFASGFNE